MQKYGSNIRVEVLDLDTIPVFDILSNHYDTAILGGVQTCIAFAWYYQKIVKN